MSQPLPTRRPTRAALRLSALAAALLLAAVAAAPVGAKMFGQGRLDAQISLQSPPGEILLVGAVVEVMGDDGELAGTDVPVILELVGRYGDRTSAVSVVVGAAGHHAFEIEVPAGGHYRFKYLADGGEWFCDPEAAGVELNEYHEANSVLRV